MMYPLVRELADDGIPVTVSCRVLKIARAPYYRWLRTPVGPVKKRRSERITALCDAHADDPEFGYRLLADEARQAGFPAVMQRGRNHVRHRENEETAG